MSAPGAALDVMAIFNEALEHSSASARAAYLDRACGGDSAIRARVEILLRAHDCAGGFLESPAQSPTIDDERPMTTEAVGTAIGPYMLMEQIGEGGMGTVYVAEQAKPVRRKVALKIIKPGMDTKQVIARFEAERQALAMMDHPNIARVFDGGATESGRPYFVMELVRGMAITGYCDHEQLSIRERLDLFVLVCRAVQHAHQKGIIHRDLKPSNILVTIIDGVAVPKVIDFGVAKATGDLLTDRTVYTAFHQFVGTPLYMSPEQADLSGMDVDTRSDIYSLGVLLYELLTGTTPFDRETFRTVAFDEMRRMIREEEPPRPSTRLSSLGETRTTVSANRKTDVRQLDRTVRGDLDWIAMKALEKDRRRRYETASDLAADLMRYLTDQPVEASPPSAGYRLRKFVRRNRGPMAAGLSLAALLALGTVGTSIGLVRALRAEARAKEEAAVATAVRDFLTDDLLAEASPDKNPRDKKVTVEELLGRAATRIAGKFARQPGVEAEIRYAIGDTYVGLGDFTAAQPHLERAWELGQLKHGEEHPRTLHFMSSLGMIYMEQGEFAKATALLTKALKISRRVLGGEHRETLKVMTDLAMAYAEQGKDTEAESLYVKALEVSRSALGEEDSDTLRIMSNLSTLYVGTGRFAEAEPLLVKVLEICRRDIGEMHPNTLDSMNNLAGFYWFTGNLGRSVPLFEDVLKRSQAVRGPDHPVTLSIMANLGINHRDAGDLRKGIAYLEQAWELARKRSGSPINDTEWIRHALVETYDRAGQFAKAEPLAREALEAARERYGAVSPPVALALDSLGRILVQQHKDAEAESLLRQCLELREQNEPKSWTASNTRSLLGGSLLGQKNYAEAEPLLLAGYEGMKQREGTIPSIARTRLTEATERLVELYEATGKTEKAAEWRAKLPVAKSAKPAEAATRPGLNKLPEDVFARP